MEETAVCYSDRFQDIYFSLDDGLAETRHVFLDGNRLPEAWLAAGSDVSESKTVFTIAETGFGSGLNFLAAAALFEQTAPTGCHLRYIAWEQYPLPAAKIRDALACWSGEFNGLLERLLAVYASDIHADVHTEIHSAETGTAFFLRLSERILLELIVGDVNVAMAPLQARVDAWFLDGFAPARNPEMWSDTVFREMARMSRPGTTLATFTAAGFVRRGLSVAGFNVGKRPGYGRKRHMLTGVFP